LAKPDRHTARPAPHSKAPAALTPRQAATELARLLATAAGQRQSEDPIPPLPQGADAGRLRELIAGLSADSEAVAGFFPRLGRELEARGLRLPEIDAAHLPPELLPLLATLDATLAPSADSEAGEIDHEAAARQLDAQLHALLGASPREARERLHETRIRERTGARVAAAMRRNGLVPLRDTPAPGQEEADSFWDLVDLACRDRMAFVQRLDRLPRERLATFYWEHRAAVMALDRSGPAEPAGAPLDTPGLPLDLAADAARIFSQRFGEPLAPGL
jgi:hypothetical protein